MTLSQRFWSRIKQPSAHSCWEWMGEIHNGYGRLHHTRAHRFTYEEVIGAVPPGLELDHLCRNRRCVNPFHLDPVTRRALIYCAGIRSLRNMRSKHTVLMAMN